MHKTISRHLRFWTALFVLSGYLALTTTQRTSSVILAIPVTFLALAPLGEWLDARFRSYRRITMLFNLICIALIPFMVTRMTLMSSVITLIVYIQAYTMLHQKSPRNYLHLYLMAFFLLLAACVESPDPAIGPILFLFLITTFMSLMLFQIWLELEQTKEDSAPIIIPLDATSELDALPSSPRFFDGKLIAIFTSLALFAFLITSAIFLAVPRMEAGILGRPDTEQTITGISSSVDLSESGSIKRDMTPVMRVEFPKEKNGQYDGLMLWRTSALNLYQDAKWERSRLRASETQPLYARFTNEEHEEHINQFTNESCPDGRIVEQSIYLDNIPPEGIPCLATIKQLRIPGDRHDAYLRWANTGDFSLKQVTGSRTWLQYNVTSHIRTPSPEQLRAARTDYASDLAWSDLEMVTSHDLLPETIQLAKELTAKATTPYDKAVALSKFLNGPTFVYSLSLPEAPHEHPVDHFINASRMGHCELYASAMALMLRSLGIPTRVVSGYRGGEWTNGDHTYTVRADMAHLWVEVYFLDIGWVAFDPTPPDNGPTGIASTKIARLLSHYLLYMKIVWYQDVIGYNQGFQLSALKNIAMGFIGLATDLFTSETAKTDKPSHTPGINALWMLARIVLVGGVLWFGIHLLLRKHKHRYILTPDQRRATKLYGYLIKKLERLQLPCRGLSAEEIAQEAINRHYPEQSVKTIIDAYNESRFGSASLTQERYRAIRHSIQRLHPPKT